MSAAMDPALAHFVAALAMRGRSNNNPTLTRPEALSLASLLNSTMNRCSTRSIQLCTNAVIKYVLPYKDRSAAFSRYMTSLSGACKPRPADFQYTMQMSGTYELAGLQEINNRYNVPSSAVKRLHALYIVWNVVAALQQCPPADLGLEYGRISVASAVDDAKGLAVRLFELAACRGDAAGDNVASQLARLLDGWHHEGVFDDAQIDTLKAAANSAKERDLATVLEQHAAEDTQKILDARKADAESKKFIIPRKHGVRDDPNAPWWELPAANGLYMRRIRGYPLRAAAFPDGGYALNNAGKEADKELQKEVTNLKNELLHCFAKGSRSDEVQGIDPLGNIIYKDPERPTRNYWGFSYDGINKIKEIESESKKRTIGYGGVRPLRPDQNPFYKPNYDVQKAWDLANRGRGNNGRGGYGQRGGGFRGNRGGGRGGFQGGRGGTRGFGP